MKEICEKRETDNKDPGEEYKICERMLCTYAY